jgi:hypothetical protein
VDGRNKGVCKAKEICKLDLHWELIFSMFQCSSLWLAQVKTISGRRRYLDAVDSDDRALRAQAERQVSCGSECKRIDE